MVNEEDPLLYDDDLDNESQRQVSLADVWNNNPALKLFAIVGALGLAIIAFLVLGGDNEKPDLSRVAAAGNVSEAPGQTELTPAYEEAVEQADNQRAQEAELQGGSAMPTPIGRPTERIEAPADIEEEDPLAQWRREAEKRREERNRERPPTLPDVPQETTNNNTAPALPTVPQIDPRQQMRQQLPTGPTPEQVGARAQLFQNQMSAILQARVPQQSILVNQGIQPAYVVPTPESETETAMLLAESQDSATSLEVQKEMLLPAGTIEYGQIVTAANSDIPGPVLAQIASGPLAGARALGSFTMQDEYLVLSFTKAVLNGKEYAINAIAIDPATTLTGVATDVDHYYFSRVFLPGAAKFIEGWASAVTRQGTSVVVTGETVSTTQDKLDTGDELLAGFEEAAGEFADIVDDRADKKELTVKVASGTRVGLLFLDSIFKE